MPIVNGIADLHQDITGWRRDFHAHPELQFDVHRTAGAVAALLKSFGCDEVVPGIGRTQSRRGDPQPQAQQEGGRASEADAGCPAARGRNRPALCLDGLRQDARLRA